MATMNTHVNTHLKLKLKINPGAVGQSMLIDVYVPAPQPGSIVFNLLRLGDRFSTKMNNYEDV